MIQAAFKELCPTKGLVLADGEPCVTPEIKDLMVRIEDYYEFFRRCVGSPPWEVQKNWAKRVLSGRSFAAIAPTGVGKTVFGLVTSYYMAGSGRSYLIFPTSLLVNQAREILEEYMKRAGKEVRLLVYRGNMKTKEKREFMERLKEADFDILITTSQFLSRRADDIAMAAPFKFIFVDDIDSFLKNSRNVDRVLKLMGFTEDEIMRASKGERIYKDLDSVLVVSTATGRPGQRAKLFRNLLGFDVGVIRQEYLRNVTDMYTKDEGKFLEFLREMGPGLLAFVPRLELAEKVKGILSKAGLKSEIMSGYDEKLLEKFVAGELDALIGAAKPYGVLVRGVDLPQRIRYVVFYGVPRFELTLKEVDEMQDSLLIAVYTTISKALGPTDRRLALSARARLTEEKVRAIRERLREVLASDELLKKVSESGDVVLDPENMKLMIPDVRSYIQGSGRSSRLYPGGMTKGASLVYDKDPMMTSFLKRASAYDIEFFDVTEVDLASLREEIDEDRRKYAKLKGEFKETAGLLKTILFVVESPNKARTIAKFFGRPSRRIIGDVITYETTTGNYVVTIVASGGHVVDLSTQGGYHGVLIEEYNGSRTFVPIYSSIKRCYNCGYQFTDGDRCPRCGSTNLKDSRSNIDAIRWLAFEADRVLIGTDPDTEGEKIAWDIYQMIRGMSKEIYRAEFHEVTKRAIMKAMQELLNINEPRVKAQIVRRVEDRWIGFELSGELQRVFKNRTLSAGRAQTPTLGWIIERYEEHKKKKEITLIRGDEIFLRAEGKLGEKGRRKAKIELLEEVEENASPPPPFTTDEMIKEANRVLRMDARKVMDLAQSLFEAGLITYHRTDSTRVSDAGWRVASEYLGDSFVPRKWGEGGAHECIRPTKPLNTGDLIEYVKEGVIIPPEPLTKDHYRLYDLIFRRFMASQTKESVIRKQKYKVSFDGAEIIDERVIEAKGGWVEFYPFFFRVLPPIKPGEIEIDVKHVKVPLVPLYTQGDIVALMKERGIGRPSTYATIMEKLLIRRYVIEKKGKLLPTKLGIEVYTYLVDNYEDLISEERTRLLEEKMSLVEEGKADHQEVINELFEEIIEKVVMRRTETTQPDRARPH